MSTWKKLEVSSNFLLNSSTFHEFVDQSVVVRVINVKLRFNRPQIDQQIRGMY